MKLWIARDKSDLLTVYNEKPELHYGKYWDGDYGTQAIDVPEEMFPEVTFENSPQEVELILCNHIDTVNIQDPKNKPVF